MSAPGQNAVPPPLPLRPAQPLSSTDTTTTTTNTATNINPNLPPQPNQNSQPEQHQAGGGATMAMRSRPLNTFSAPVLAHLKNIHANGLAAEAEAGAGTHPQGGTISLQQQEAGGGAPPTTQSLQSFLTYMASPASAAMSPPKSTTPEALSHPISSYYISTSHNTYLSGNQLYGDASAAAYRNVLLRGCRSLEIDVWNGEEGGGGWEGVSSEREAAAGAGGEGGEGGGKHESMSERLGRLAAKVKDRVSSRSRSRSNSRLHVHNPLHHHSSNSAVVAPSAPLSSTLTNPATDAMPAPWRPSRNIIEPRVLHGHTLTREVSFRSVCEAIRDNAFVASSLPVIVSLEVHADLQQQEIMVEIMRQTWQGLLIDLEEAQNVENITYLPSPDDLRNKILIKVKWSPADPNSKTAESTDPRDHLAVASMSEEEDEEGGEDYDENRFAPPPTSHSNNPGEPVEKNKKKKAQKASKILHELSKMGVYTRAYSFKTFSAPEASLVNHVFSLSEAKVKDFCEDSESPHAAALFQHNRNFLMRIFPSGLRVNSSNVEPTFLWRQGAQMVALNWQKWDRGMMLNEGMFAGEGGWVLKPQGYRGTTTPEVTDTIAMRTKKGDDEDTIVKRTNMNLTIEVLAGQDIPLPAEKNHASRFHPYVKMQLHVDCRPPTSENYDAISSQITRGVGPPPPAAAAAAAGPSENDEGSDADDSEAFKRRSKTSKTADPDFGGEKLQWTNLIGVIEELSFLRVKIQDDRIGTDDLAAWACIRLDRLQTGYRFIHLLDSKGMESTGALLVRIIKTAVV